MSPQERRAVKRLGDALETIAVRCRDPVDPFAVVIGELVLAVVREAPTTGEHDAGPVRLGVVVERIIAELRAEAERHERNDRQRTLEWENGEDEHDRMA